MGDTYRICAPLYRTWNYDEAMEPFRLAEGVVLRPFSYFDEFDDDSLARFEDLESFCHDTEMALEVTGAREVLRGEAQGDDSPFDTAIRIYREPLKRIKLANLAIWLAEGKAPSIHHFFVIDEAYPRLWRWKFSQRPLLNAVELGQNIVRDFGGLQRMHELLCDEKKLQRPSSVFTALDFTWNALVSRERFRVVNLWVAMEALFGPTHPPTEISHRLGNRAAFFLGEKGDRKRIAKAVRDSYSIRSTIVHGNIRTKKVSKKLADLSEPISELEGWIRSALLKILRDDELLSVFCSDSRNTYLDDLVFE